MIYCNYYHNCNYVHNCNCFDCNNAFPLHFSNFICNPEPADYVAPTFYATPSNMLNAYFNNTSLDENHFFHASLSADEIMPPNFACPPPRLSCFLQKLIVEMTLIFMLLIVCSPAVFLMH